METDNRALNMLKSALGPIRSFFEDPKVLEIYINSEQVLWVEYQESGRKKTDIHIPAEDTRKIIEMVASFSNTIITKEKPIISAELPFFGYRFEGSIPPITLYPSFNIRKPAIKLFSLDDYLVNNIISNNQLVYLKQAIKEKKNILVVGGTGSGKTTLTNAILEEISKIGDRLIILEDTRELNCTAKDYESFRTQDNVTMTDLVKSAMRRRPDRIIVGEVRDKAALDLLKAWNTGHPGGVCTIHANSASDGLLRMEQLIQEVIATPQQKLIAETIDVIIYITRTIDIKDGKSIAGRKIKELAFCHGYFSGNYSLSYLD